MQRDTAPWREGELLCVLRVSLPALLWMDGTALWARGVPPQQAVALGSFFGRLLERLVGEGDTELFCTNPFHLPHVRKIALDHSHAMPFSLERVCRKTVLSWSALFWV